MRTTLDIDAKLLEKAMRTARVKTKKAAVEQGLAELINAGRRRKLIGLAGKGYGMTLKEFLQSRKDG